MRTGILATLAAVSLAGAVPAPVRGPVDMPFSRVENRSPQAWRVGMGRWVAGEIRIQQPDGRAEIARLKREGEGFVMQAGQTVHLKVLPTRGSLALQVTFSRVDGAGVPASVFVSQGNPGDKPTLNVNEAPTVRVEKAWFGRSADGPFILIQ
jgi:hypothetical protein